MGDVERWHELGQQLRVDSIRAAAVTNSGHPTSSMSAADLMAVLMTNYLHYDFDAPENPNNDHLIFSKGHASPLLYSMYKAAGAISEEELLTFRKFGSRLEGHPVPVLPWVDVATGSLGQGLPISVGVALAGKNLDRLPFRVWCLCGDSEMAEGSMWEAFEHAAFYELDNLVAVLDINRLGQRGPTMHEWDLNSYANRARAFGWKAIEIDGHDYEEIDRAYAEAIETHGQPTAIVARTIKGKGVKEVENKEGWHGKALDHPDEAITELGGVRNEVIQVPKPEESGEPHVFETSELELPRYDEGDDVATRKAYGDALAALGSANGKVVAVDGEVSNSTFAEIFKEAHPDRYFEMYIAEQQMVAASVGMQVRGWHPFASTFACFLSRAYDLVRMAAISRARFSMCGSHAGVSIGPVIYGPHEEFPVGGARVVRSSDDDDVTIVGAGITLHEALKAADALAEEGVSARVIDLYSVKPVDAETLQAAAEATGGRIVTVEDHWPEGGLGEAVLSVFADSEERPQVVKLAVQGMPGSGKPDELLAAAGIDAEHIAEAVRRLVSAAALT